jgi:hypothetical protein
VSTQVPTSVPTSVPTVVDTTTTQGPATVTETGPQVSGLDQLAAAAVAELEGSRQKAKSPDIEPEMTVSELVEKVEEEEEILNRQVADEEEAALNEVVAAVEENNAAVEGEPLEGAPTATAEAAELATRFMDVRDTVRSGPAVSLPLSRG